MAKRCFDILLSAFGLVLSAPISLLIAVCIFLEDRGPVFFRQERIGKYGKVFLAFKFRSMKIGSAQETQALEDDPRITRVGRILRATAMDELPQLWNIFKGEMSFVGPRALLAEEEEIHSSPRNEKRIQTLFEKRCTVTPGLTGIAQIFAPRDVPREKKYRYDLLYVKKRSFLLDLKLIFLSFVITFLGRWETRKNKLWNRKGTVHV